MLALLLSLVFLSPMPFYPTPEMDSCDQVVCPFTPQGSRVCYCAPAVLNLGEW